MGHIDFNDKDTKQVDLAIEEQLILVKEIVSSREEIIKKLAALLFDNGFVKDTYTQAVLDREIEYPTGLQARVTGVAVPHTDTEHVLKPAIAIATLAETVVFKGMGMPDNEINVDTVIMLAVQDPNKVITVLRSVIFILEDDVALRGIQNAVSKSEIKELMINHIKSLKI